MTARDRRSTPARRPCGTSSGRTRSRAPPKTRLVLLPARSVPKKQKKSAPHDLSRILAPLHHSRTRADSHARDARFLPPGAGGGAPHRPRTRVARRARAIPGLFCVPKSGTAFDAHRRFRESRVRHGRARRRGRRERRAQRGVRGDGRVRFAKRGRRAIHARGIATEWDRGLAGDVAERVSISRFVVPRRRLGRGVDGGRGRQGGDDADGTRVGDGSLGRARVRAGAAEQNRERRRVDRGEDRGHKRGEADARVDSAVSPAVAARRARGPEPGRGASRRAH